MKALGVDGGIFQDPPYPPDWVVHVRALFSLRGTDLERPYINDHGNFKIKFQTYIFEIILNDNSLKLMYVYTTSDLSHPKV
jgi:hypothetical protein